ncbi:MAG: Crp/Fnr family transcriptional regulator, partial [Oxalobacteraceae bacterium]
MQQQNDYVTTNTLLHALSPSDIELLRPHLHRVPLMRDEVVVKAHEPIEHVYFPEGGVVS